MIVSGGFKQNYSH